MLFVCLFSDKLVMCSLLLFNTLAAELLFRNSSSLIYATFSLVMQYCKTLTFGHP